MSTNDVRSARLASVDAPVREAFASLVMALGLLEMQGPADVADGVPADLAAEHLPRFAWRIRAARQLARELVPCLTGRATAHRALLSAARELDSALDAEDDARAVSEALGAAPPEMFEQASPERQTETASRGIIAVEALLQEWALEEHDVGLLVDEEPADVRFEWCPVPADSARVFLLDRFWARQAAAVALVRRLWPQRAISDWFFDVWSVPGPSPLDDEHRRGLRANEFRYAERHLPELDATLVGAYCNGPACAALPARQRALAISVRDSRASGFEVERVRRGELTFVDTVNGGRYSVHDYEREPACDSGCIALGRIYPLEGTRWIRSAGMVFAEPDRRGEAEKIGRLLRELTSPANPGGGVPAGIAVEGVISRIKSDVDIPRRVRPAGDAGDAAERFGAVLAHLEREGIPPGSDAITAAWLAAVAAARAG